MGSPRPGPVTPDLGDPERVVGVVFGCRPEDVAERVVVTPFVPLKAFLRHVDVEECRLAPPFFYKGFTARLQGRRVTVVLTGVGPSRVGDCLGFLSLTPARRVLFAGAVGALAPGARIGEWFVPTEVADGEGYTRYVVEPFPRVVASARRVPVAPGSVERLARFLEARGDAVRRGPVFTVGSLTFESPENLGCLAARGFHALEMELSAFFAAAGRHGLEPECLTYVSDLPLASSLWTPRTAEEEGALRAAYRALPEVCLEYLCAP